MNDGFEARVGLIGSHCDAVELLELAEKILGEVAPFVNLWVDGERCGAPRTLRDDNLDAACVGIGNNGDVELLVCAQRIPPIDERRHADVVVTMAGQWFETDKIAGRACQREDFGRQADLGTPDSLALSPPFRSGRGGGP